MDSDGLYCIHVSHLIAGNWKNHVSSYIQKLLLEPKHHFILLMDNAILELPKELPWQKSIQLFLFMQVAFATYSLSV